MKQIIECVANFSEGRRFDVIDRIVHAIDDVSGVAVLGAESDADHHRSVVTFVGSPKAVAAAAFAGIREASLLIDMEKHQGQHPRIGAADVIPLIPLQNVSMADCVRWARDLGKRVGMELNLPIFLYEEAALQAANRNLADIRRGGYEQLRQTIETGAAPQPDFGPSRMSHAGACVIGARHALIALNVYLPTSDVEIARKIARAIRHSSGGLRYVKALGLLVKGQAQVSMNLTNYEKTPIHRVMEMIRREAGRYGLGIEGSELIGFVPQDALFAAAAWYMQMDNLTSERVLENRLAGLK